MSVFYTKKGIVTSEYCDKKKQIVCTWYNLYYDKIFKECCIAHLDIITEETVIIFDLKKTVGIPSSKTILWIIEYYIPKLKKTGFKLLVIVKPEDRLKNIHELWLKMWKNFSNKTLLISDISEVDI